MDTIFFFFLLKALIDVVITSTGALFNRAVLLLGELLHMVSLLLNTIERSLTLVTIDIRFHLLSINNLATCIFYRQTVYYHKNVCIIMSVCLHSSPLLHPVKLTKTKDSKSKTNFYTFCRFRFGELELGFFMHTGK